MKVKDLDKARFIKNLNDAIENGHAPSLSEEDKEKVYEGAKASNRDYEMRMKKAFRMKVLNVVGFYLFIFFVVMFSNIIFHGMVKNGN